MGYNDDVDSGGGLLLDYTGTVSEAFFEDGQYGPRLTVKVLLDNPGDYPRINDGIINNWFPIQPKAGYKIAAAGKQLVAIEWTAQNGNGQEAPTKFRADSPIGQLLKQMQVVDTTETLYKGGLTSTDAAFWAQIGHARWGAVQVAGRKQDEQGVWQATTKDVSMPIELLGGQAATNGHQTAFDPASLGVTDDVLTQLREAAKAAGDYGKFLPTVMGMPGMLGSQALAVLGDTTGGQSAYEALKADAEVY